MPAKGKKAWIIGLFPVLLALVFNLNVLQNGLAWDDERIIPNIRVPESWTPLFLRDRSEIPVRGSRDFYYRPLVSVSYVADHWIWGDDPFGFHLTTLLFHGLNTALVFILAGSLTLSKGRSFSRRERPPPGGSWTDDENGVPFLSASLFAVHPVHAEAVAWIAGRNDVICTTFLLGALLAFLRFQKGGSWSALGLTGILFFMALLTKELALGLIFLFPLVVFFQRGREGSSPTVLSRAKIRASWVFLPAVLAGYFWLRFINLPLPLGPPGSPGGLSPGSALDGLRILGFYFGVLLLPFPHRPFIGSIPGGWGSFLTAGGLLACLAWGMVFSLKRGVLVPGVGMAWTVLLLLPAAAAGILRPAVTPLAERYVYGASAGFLVVAGWVLQRGLVGIRNKQQKARIILYPLAVLTVGGLVVWGGWLGWHRNRVWVDPATFWAAAVDGSPEAAFPHEQRGIHLSRENLFPEAEREFRLALKYAGNDGERITALSNLGNLLTRTGRYAEALAVLQKTAKIDPDNDEVLWHLSDLLFRLAVQAETEVRGETVVTQYDEVLFAEGEKNLKRALALRPMLPLYWEAGRIYERFHRPAEALKYYLLITGSGKNVDTEIAEKARRRADQIRNSPGWPKPE